MRARGEILFWTLMAVTGAVATYEFRRIDSAFAVATPQARDVQPREAKVASLVNRAKIVNTSLGYDTQAALALATRLMAPAAMRAQKVAAVDKALAVASIASFGEAAQRLRDAMQRTAARARPSSALTALARATGTLRAVPAELTAYGELTPYPAPERRLTILQLGDSHTAADFFTGRVRARLQEAFGDGGDAFLVPGAPHVGVRSALFSTDASERLEL